MGVAAGHLLLDLLADGDQSGESSYKPILLAPSLVVRSSTGPADPE
jgi:DNA-binding LacI/PurR family transcriptional regulator